MKSKRVIILVGLIVILIVFGKLVKAPKEIENQDLNRSENTLIENIHPADSPIIVNVDGVTKGETYDLREYFANEVISDQKDLGAISLDGLQASILEYQVIRLSKKEGKEFDGPLNISENSLMNNFYVSLTNNGSEIENQILNVSLIDSEGEEYQSFINFEDGYLLNLKKSASKIGSVSFLLEPDSQAQKLIFNLNGQDFIYNFN